MPVSIVVGGQFGSEGKGKVAHYLAQKMEASYAVRCGGPNSGHTVIDPKGNARIFQQLPTASILKNVKLAICAGSYIDLDILLKEVQETGVSSNRLIIDPNALIITRELREREAKSGLIERIGSTGSGTGAAVIARINREKSLNFARDVKELLPFINDVSDILRNSLSKNERVIIEGTQGFGLSPLHSKHFPYVTSRDTTAAAFLSETGLSPMDVDEIVLTIRAFPIRVAGNSGPLLNETTWKEIADEGGFASPFEEKTSVSKKTRRVARFNPLIVRQAIQTNKPSSIVLNHLDYLVTDDNKLSKNIIANFVKDVETSINHRIDYVGLGQEVTMHNSLTSFEVKNG